jgi:hypothetical protein
MPPLPLLSPKEEPWRMPRSPVRELRLAFDHGYDVRACRIRKRIEVDLCN